MRRSESIDQIGAALAKAQGEITGASKDRENPHFKSKYADLASVWDACRAPLAKNSLAVIQSPSVDEAGNLVLLTMLVHGSGQYFEEEFVVTPAQRTAQGYGSVVTYLRRYSLMAMVGVAPEDEDDDGNAGSFGPRQAAAPVRSQPAAPKPAPAAAAPKAQVAVRAEAAAAPDPGGDGDLKVTLAQIQSLCQMVEKGAATAWTMDQVRIYIHQVLKKKSMQDMTRNEYVALCFKPDGAMLQPFDRVAEKAGILPPMPAADAAPGAVGIVKGGAPGQAPTPSPKVAEPASALSAATDENW